MIKNLFIFIVPSLMLQSCSSVTDINFCSFLSWKIIYIYMIFVGTICNDDIIVHFWTRFSTRFFAVTENEAIRLTGWTLAPFVGNYLVLHTHFLNTDFLRFLCGFVGTLIITALIPVKYMKPSSFAYIIKVSFRYFTWGIIIFFAYMAAKSFNL